MKTLRQRLFDKYHWKEAESNNFFPIHLIKEVRVGLIFFWVFIGLCIFWYIGFEDPADPFSTPLGIKPEWYFLSQYQALKYFDKLTGVIVTMIGPGAIILFPFLTKIYGSELSSEVPDKIAKFRINVTLLIFIFGWFTLTGLAWISETEQTINGKEYHFDLKGFPHQIEEVSAEHLPGNLDEHACARCHASSNVKPKKGSDIVNPYLTGVHYEMAIFCQECHGGNPKIPKDMLPLTDDELKKPDVNKRLRKHAKKNTGFKGAPRPSMLGQYCGKCHEKVVDNYKDSLHSLATSGEYSKEALENADEDDEEFDEEDAPPKPEFDYEYLGNMRGCLDCHEIHGAQRAGLRNFNERVLHEKYGRAPYKGCESSECHQSGAVEKAKSIKEKIVSVTTEINNLEEEAHELAEKGVFVSSKTDAIFEKNKKAEKALRIAQHSMNPAKIDAVLNKKKKWIAKVEEDVKLTEDTLHGRYNFFIYFSIYMFVLILLVSRYINLMKEELDTPTEKEESDIPFNLDLKKKD